MKTAFILFFIVLIWGLDAKAVAPYGIKGQNQSATLYSNVHQFPNNQVTNIGGINALVETGNTNLLANPNFEHSTYDTSWTLTAGSKAPESTKVVNGVKSFKATLAGQTLELFQNSSLYASQFAGTVQGLAMVRVNTTVSGIFVCSGNNTLPQLSNCVAVDNSGTWGLYKVPFVLGTTNNGIYIVSGTQASGLVTVGNVTGDVFVDEAFVGAANIIDTADQSRIAGESYFAGTTNCSGWNRTSTTMGALTSDADCPGPTIVTSSVGSWQTTDSDLPRQTINNLPAGTYKAKFYFSTDMNVAGNGGVSINDGTTTCEPVFSTQLTTAGVIGSVVECTFVYTTSGNRVFELYAGATGTGNIRILNANTTPRMSTKFILEYFGSGQTYSSQCGANCVDVLSAKVSSTDVTSDENVNFISGDCTNATTGRATCTFVSGIFTVTPNCVALTTTGTMTEIVSQSSSAVTVQLRNSAGTVTDNAFNLVCQKTGADFTASRTIVGSFKNVVTTPSVTKPVMYSFSLTGGGVVSKEFGDVVNGNCTNANPRVCTFNSIWASAPNCVVTSNDGSDTGTNATSISTSSLSVNTFNQAGTALSRDSIVICHGEGL